MKRKYNISNETNLSQEEIIALRKQRKEEKKNQKKKDKKVVFNVMPQKKSVRTKIVFENPTPVGEKKDVSVLHKAYEPQIVESAWNDWWIASKFYTQEYQEDKKTFTILLPPPNITGVLHIGHALTTSIQDVICRYYRMRGYQVCWVPGTDHAGIATQSVIEKKLKKERGLTRYDLGREKFIKEIWEWEKKYGDVIYEQIKRLGASLDWSRKYFTYDDERSKGVTEAFIRLFNDGLIYRESRLVNWCCAMRTAISDLECDIMELDGITKLAVPGHPEDRKYTFGAIWEFAYQEVESGKEIIVATTRPETIFGDTAIAVHPDDPRYKKFHGKQFKHPLLDRIIPIILDDQVVDMNKGTGAVKITPAHDPNDYITGKKHNLESIEIFNDDGTLNSVCGDFKGMLRYDARKAVLVKLTELGLYKNRKPNPMVLSICSRSGDILEPVLKPQWWVNTSTMAENAYLALRNGELEIPENHHHTWRHFLTNSQPWCVSRQIWWGHRIPAYKLLFTSDVHREEWVVGRDHVDAEKNAKLKFPNEKFTLQQDEDVLDTWFSSSLLPMSVFGWPDQSVDFNRFYPNNALETGYDILFFWVARMVMMCMYFTGKLPFRQILLHNMVRDSFGRKMSKSLGNALDPLDLMEGISLDELNNKVLDSNLSEKEKKKAITDQKKNFPSGISECGSDALRFGLCAYTAQGRDINLDVSRIEGYRNFCNKIWNSFKFSWTFIENYTPPPTNFIPQHKLNKWITHQLNNVIRDVEKGISTYDFASATSSIHSFWLYDFCDFYLEALKSKLYQNPKDEDFLQTLYYTVESFLKILHPFMPFITEDLWQRLKKIDSAPETISLSKYPVFSTEFIEDETAREIEEVKTFIKDIRSFLVKEGKTRKDKPHLVAAINNMTQLNTMREYEEIISSLTFVGKLELNFDSNITQCSFEIN